MTHKIHHTGAGKFLGPYSDAIETGRGLRWLYTAGTPGFTDAGELPEGIEAQSRLAWSYILSALEKAGMTTADLVKVTTTVVNSGDVPAYVNIRKEVLGEVKPVFMTQVVNQLIKPGILLEIEAIAARE